MKKQRVACGFVLIRKRKGEIQYLLLTNAKRDEPGLPKGHAESGETDLETAFRETEEETGLTDYKVFPRFRRELIYPASRNGQFYEKRVVYFLARLRSGRVQLSKEHSGFQWADFEQAWHALPFPSLRGIVREAALWLKDPALFKMEPWSEAEAYTWLTAQPDASKALVAHLRGAARLARVFATALAAAGVSVHVEATASGALLHDAGRALGEHADHQRAGLEALRRTPLAPYAYACVSHFTRGARVKRLVRAGVDPEMLKQVGGWIDLKRLTWEERCVALADACMLGDKVVRPDARFADLRKRYADAPVIDLQERQTRKIRRQMKRALGRDPLRLIGL